MCAQFPACDRCSAVTTQMIAGGVSVARSTPRQHQKCIEYRRVRQINDKIKHDYYSNTRAGCVQTAAVFSVIAREPNFGRLLPHTVNCVRFCFWRRQSVTFLFAYEIYREPLNRFSPVHAEDVFGPLLGRV